MVFRNALATDGYFGAIATYVIFAVFALVFVFVLLVVIGRVGKFGPAQVWTASPAAILSVAEGALGFKQLLAQGIAGWMSRSLRESAGNNESGQAPSHDPSSIPVPQRETRNEKRSSGGRLVL